MGFILENETASILARMKTIRKGFRAWNHPMLAHSRPNITHLATNFVSLSDSSETHLSTGRVRQTFASNGKRRAGRDGLGEVKGPRYTASTPPPTAAAASPGASRANGTVGAEQRGRHVAIIVGVSWDDLGHRVRRRSVSPTLQATSDLSRLHGIAGLPGPSYDVWVQGSPSATLDR